MFRGHTCSLRLLKLFNFKIFGVPQKPTPGLKQVIMKKNCFGFCIIIENTILLTRNLLSSTKTSSVV